MEHEKKQEEDGAGHDGQEAQHGGHGGGMGKRGVTRPMAMHQQGGGHDHDDKHGGGDHDEKHEHGDHDEKHEHGDHEHDGGGHDHGQEHSGHGKPYDEHRYQMLDMHHKQTLWVYWTLILLGCWTAVAPFNFGYLNPELWVDPSGGRGVWFSESTHTQLRAQLMTWSDVISGLLLIVLGWRGLRPNRPVSLWFACGVGAWLSAAPVLFWAPTAASYLNDTIVGMLVLALTVLIPGMPNMVLYMKMGPPTPPGWSYNPSSWPQRWIMIVTGFAGLLVSRYLAMFQMGYIDTIWDPIFGDSTRKVLNSNMSHSLPISDAGLGTLAYTFEFLMGFMGSPSRWRTMPWMVTLFGILVIPLGLVHIVLVISQPVIVGNWCTFCLLAAAIMLPMIPLEVDEVIAMGQHLFRSKRAGTSLWTAFWKGGPAEEDSTPDTRSPELVQLPDRPLAVIKAAVWGMSFSWWLAVTSVIGLAMMATPALLNIAKPASAVFHLGGSLVVVVSIICMGEVVRIGRYLNVLLGAILAIGPWLLEGADLTGKIVGVIAGVAVAALSIPRGPVYDRYGNWDRFVK